MQRVVGPQLTVNKARERTRQRIQNATFSGASGAQGAGDRGAWQSVPMYSGNPYDSNDFVYRWRQYVHLYETSWEARKIVRIPVEDALRKEWIAEGLEEEIAKAIALKLKQMNFLHVLSRSLMLERLLGGCLTFLGLDSNEDNTDKRYNPREGSALRFFNAIPISRISRMTWDTNPLSEYYMRPTKYLINGEGVHVSRCLVWDGEPLFDPYDFALTNFRSNLAGFGPSKLAPIWDDIVKAVGTRQAAYQLIQTNNAIIAAVSGLQDLAGTTPGNASLKKLKEIANSLSVFRATLVDADRVNVTQSAASFGSVPELIITFIQVLSAASDIPATRFIGQAPGGLNATGESDLENYYNMLDSYQLLRIEPALRRTYDMIGYNMFSKEWPAAREKLTFKFPPLWNLSEKEEAERAALVIDNAIKVRDNTNAMTDEKFIDELNLKNVFSIQLDQTDISNIKDTGLGGEKELPPANPEEEIKKLRNVYIKNADSISLLIKAAGGDPERIDREQFVKGLSVEQEHFNTTHGDEVAMAKIVLDHLAEDPDYYIKLDQYIENSAFENFVEKRGDQWVVLSHDKSKTLGEYDTQEAADKRLRQIEYFKHQNSHDGKNIAGFTVQIKEDPKTKTFYVVDGDLILANNFSTREGASEWILSRQQQNSGEDTWAKFKNYAAALGFTKKAKGENAFKNKKGKMLKLVDSRGEELTVYEEGKGQYKIANRIHLDILDGPTEGQKQAGNYKKHHIKLHGLDFSIENPYGSERSGKDKNGQPWSVIMPCHYGDVKKTEGKDGENVDAYIGPHEDSELIFVVDQNDADTGKFDEHKCIFGALSMTQAKELYLAGFSDGRGVQRLGAITPMTINEFKQWLKEGDTTKPFANAD
jgi:phage-related protein (TIGR01555 family)